MCCLPVCPLTSKDSLVTVRSMPMAWHDQKSHVAPHFNHVDFRFMMVSLTMSSASHATNANANGSTRPESHAAPHFNNFDIRNGMVQLMMPSASCDTDISVNGIVWPTCTSFQLPWLRNKVMSLLKPLAVCDASTGANCITCTKVHVSPHFDNCDITKAMVPLTTALAPQRYV